MVTDSRVQFDKSTVFATCEEMGEASVLADIEQAGVKFANSEQKWLAWEWVYGQRVKREQATEQAVRATARQTMLVAVGTFLVALFTFGLLTVEFCIRH